MHHIYASREATERSSLRNDVYILQLHITGKNQIQTLVTTM